MKLRRFQRIAALATVVVAAACGDSAAPRTPGTITVVSGGSQSATVAAALPAPVVVQVNDQDGKPLSGQTVTWSAGANSGSVSAPSSQTDRTGQAQVTWTMGTRSGAAQLTASVAALSAVVSATANPGAPSSVERAGGDAQTGVVGSALTTPLAVLVKDAHGNAVPAVNVTFTPNTGSGTVSAAAVPTNAEGRAQASWTLGGAAGAQTLTARVAAVTAPVTFTATGTAGAAATLVRVSPVTQNGTVAQTSLLTVKATDSHGNGVAGTSVNFAVTAGGGAITPSTVTTGADGNATANWTLGTVSGTHTAIATAPTLGATGLTFTVAANAGAAATVALSQAAATMQAGDSVRLVPSARDQFGNVTTPPTLTWTTSAPAVATVDQTGLVRAVAAGTADVAVNIPTIPGANATMRVTVAAPAASLNLTIAGLPAGGQGAVTIRGPNNFTRAVATTGVQSLPVAGTYTIDAAESVQGNVVYPVTPATQTVNIATGTTGTATVTYRQIADLQNNVALTGQSAPLQVLRFYRLSVPAGVSAVTFTSSGGSGDPDIYVKRGQPTLNSNDTACLSQNDGPDESCTVQTPQAGDYFITVNAFAAYSGVTMRAFTTAGGTINFNVTGLPGGASPSLTVTGPNSFNRTLSTAAPLTGLVAGQYTIVAAQVAAGAKVYAGAPSSQQVTLAAGGSVNVSVAYTETQGGFNLDIAGMHVTQAMQTMAGAIPLIAGRDGLLRVFVRGSLANTSIPDVRVRLYRNGTLVDTRTITAPSTSAPVVIDDGVLLASWNYRIPGSMIQPGLAIVAEADINNAVQEENENDNTFPSNGTPLSLDVRTTVPHLARMVPVLQPNGQVGDVTEANKTSYTSFAHALYPLPSIDVDVRTTPYSYSSILDPNYGTTWSQLLLEIRTLRTTEGSNRYYYGVLKPSYANGGTGLGYIASPASIGVDWNTPIAAGSNITWREATVAHEWGHNFGRSHVGCGNPANPDPLYPYTGGNLAVHGWDMRTNVIRSINSHFELMSYCVPYWTSDYTYNAVMQFRGATGGMTGSGSPEPSLIVWGRTTETGEIVLEPSFEVVTRPSMPKRPGPFSIEARDAAGALIFDMSFEGEQIDHMEGVRHFSYAVPLSRLRGREVQTLRLSGSGAEGMQRKSFAAATAAGAGAEDVRLTRTGNGRVRLQWDAARNPMVLVRDPQTGDILSFARGGDQLIAVRGTELELNMSDGVKSTKRNMRIPN